MGWAYMQLCKGSCSWASWNYGCMWFSTLRTILSGTTIKSATLTLNRKTGSGSGSAKTLYLCAITNTSASGAPSIAVNYGAIGSIGRGETATFAIPVAAVQGWPAARMAGCVCMRVHTISDRPPIPSAICA